MEQSDYLHQLISEAKQQRQVSDKKWDQVISILLKSVNTDLINPEDFQEDPFGFKQRLAPLTQREDSDNVIEPLYRESDENLSSDYAGGKQSAVKLIRQSSPMKRSPSLPPLAQLGKECLSISKTSSESVESFDDIVPGELSKRGLLGSKLPPFTNSGRKRTGTVNTPQLPQLALGQTRNGTTSQENFKSNNSGQSRMRRLSHALMSPLDGQQLNSSTDFRNYGGGSARNMPLTSQVSQTESQLLIILRKQLDMAKAALEQEQKSKLQIVKIARDLNRQLKAIQGGIVSIKIDQEMQTDLVKKAEVEIQTDLEMPVDKDEVETEPKETQTELEVDENDNQGELGRVGEFSGNRSLINRQTGHQ